MFFIRVRPKICVFYIRVLNLILGGNFEIQFLAIFNCGIKGKLIDFEIEQNMFLLLHYGFKLIIRVRFGSLIKKYSPNKSYLMCLLLGGAVFSIRGED